MGDWEQEILPRLNITSIRIQETSANLEKVVIPITILDQIISMNLDKGNQILDNPLDASTLQKLFEYELDPSSRDKIKGNQYIFDTFHCFIRNKEVIDIDIGLLDEYCHNKKLLGVLFDKIIKNPSSDNLAQNIFKKDVIKIFKYTKTLKIWGAKDYKFPLLSLLNLIVGTQITTVEIKFCVSLSSLKSSSSSMDNIMNQYQKANYELTFTDDGSSLKITKKIC